MMILISFVARLAFWLLLAPLLPGIINKVKAWVAGRRGPPVLQLYYDLARLWHKQVVMSTLASPAFIMGPAVAWVAVLGATMMVPLGPAGATIGIHGRARGEHADRLATDDLGLAIRGDVLPFLQIVLRVASEAISSHNATSSTLSFA